jgi:hypothetical protein
MNQQAAKKLKKIINYEKGDPTSKRVFKRLKKQYMGLSEGAKPIFLEKLKETYNI